jgi:hypothetical protein
MCGRAVLTGDREKWRASSRGSERTRGRNDDFVDLCGLDRSSVAIEKKEKKWEPTLGTYNFGGVFFS